MSARTTLLAAAATLAGLINVGFGVSPAFAQEQGTILVSYADLNLANQAGRNILDRRIAAAATKLCGDFNPLELGRLELGRECIGATLVAVQPQRDAAVGARTGTVQVSRNEHSVRVVRTAI